MVCWEVLFHLQLLCGNQALNSNINLQRLKQQTCKKIIPRFPPFFRIPVWSSYMQKAFLERSCKLVTVSLWMIPSWEARLSTTFSTSNRMQSVCCLWLKPWVIIWPSEAMRFQLMLFMKPDRHGGTFEFFCLGTSGIIFSNN